MRTRSSILSNDSQQPCTHTASCLDNRISTDAPEGNWPRRSSNDSHQPCTHSASGLGVDALDMSFTSINNSLRHGHPVVPRSGDRSGADGFCMEDSNMPPHVATRSGAEPRSRLQLRRRQTASPSPSHSAQHSTASTRLVSAGRFRGSGNQPWDSGSNRSFVRMRPTLRNRSRSPFEYAPFTPPPTGKATRIRSAGVDVSRQGRTEVTTGRHCGSVGYGQPTPFCGYPSPNSLSLTFNGHSFSTLSGVLEHAQDYAVGEERIHIFLKIIDQASCILQLSSAFVKGLVVAIRKDASWQIEKWSKKDVIELLDPLSRHVRADGVGRKRREGALTTINRLWGAEVTGSFRESVKSEKCLRQIAHFAAQPQISSYTVARRTVNEHVINRLISRPSRQSCRFETTTADWVAVDNAVPLLHDIPYARLYAAGVYLGPFGEIREGRPPFRVPDPLPVSGVGDGNNGPGGNTPGLVEPGGNALGGGHNGPGGNNTGSVGPDSLPVSGSGDGNNGPGGNDPGLVGLGGNDLGSGCPGGEGVVSKKDNPPGVDDEGDSSSGLEDHDSKFVYEDQSTDEDDNDPPQSPALLRLSAATSVSSDLSPGAGAGAGVGVTAEMGVAIDVGGRPAVVGANVAVGADSLKAKEIFNEWSLCKRCGPRVIACRTWRLQVCDRSDEDFLAGMFLLGTAKHCVLPICDDHIDLLAKELYLVDAPSLTLRSRLDKLWESRQSTATLTAFIDDHKEWFYEALPFAFH